jgi:acetylornithine/succinyldiaminopimelate/putrescine aminotransferase
MHASTFGGNSLAMAAGLATGATIEAEGLLQHVKDNADFARERLEELQQSLPIIKELRICGMMIGIDLTLPAGAVVGKAMERGVLLNVTQDTVVRLLPALNITREELGQGLNVIAEILQEMADEA